MGDGHQGGKQHAPRPGPGAAAATIAAVRGIVAKVPGEGGPHFGRRALVLLPRRWSAPHEARLVVEIAKGGDTILHQTTMCVLLLLLRKVRGRRTDRPPPPGASSHPPAGARASSPINDVVQMRGQLVGRPGPTCRSGLASPSPRPAAGGRPPGPARCDEQARERSRGFVVQSGCRRTTPRNVDAPPPG